MSEFDLIRRYFSRGPRRPDAAIGIGDDGAVLRPPAGCELVVAMDTLVADVHFPATARATDVGHKALAVNLSDLAAMGAEAAWATLALTLPRPDPAWLEGFAAGFFALAAEHGVQLVGGDTTRGPLTVTVQAHGFIPAGRALGRAGARPGDVLLLSGTVGEAALALAAWRERRILPPAAAGCLERRWHRPSPRLALGRAARDWAHAAIDVSDGVAADLAHLLEASGVGARLELARLPLSAAARAAAAELGLGQEALWRLALSGGDDYELLLAVPPKRLEEALAAGRALGCPCTPIGALSAAPGLQLQRKDGTAFSLASPGYDHFRERQ
ncbi:MAG TPA: thiamine-phosphate kinase [Gammaproteobacteria bacterium]|nr:thiamine-phosphate kinase [Gammaproteobacteria bacterium]